MRRGLAPLLAFALSCLAPVMALAEGGFSVPDGCTADLTVQYSDCTATLDWSCAVAPAGDTWSAFFDAEGLASIVSSDTEGNWLESVYLWDGAREELADEPADPISITHLLDTGADAFDFYIRRTDDTGSRRLHVTGEDRLTGEEVEIDHVRLLRTQYSYEIREEDGTVFFSSTGAQYVDPAARVYFLGDAEQYADGESWQIESAPVDIIRPGAPGFGMTEPVYGCSDAGAKKAAFGK